jgi:hypothetical protein
MLLLPPGSTILFGPLDLTTQLLPKQNALLLDYTYKVYPGVSVAGLVPYIFGAPNLDG